MLFSVGCGMSAEYNHSLGSIFQVLGIKPSSPDVTIVPDIGIREIVWLLSATSSPQVMVHKTSRLLPVLTVMFMSPALDPAASSDARG
jgi:hypothetical protein